MGPFLNRLKRAYNAALSVNTPKSYSINNKQVICFYCGCNEFEEGSALLNTSGMTLMNLDWADRSATILICTQCGYIHWFLNQPNKS